MQGDSTDARGQGQTRARLTTRRTQTQDKWVASVRPRDKSRNGTETLNRTELGTIYGQAVICPSGFDDSERCDVEHARRPTRARGPSFQSVNPTIMRTIRYKRDGQGGRLDEEEATTTGGEPRGTPLARQTNTHGQ